MLHQKEKNGRAQAGENTGRIARERLLAVGGPPEKII